MAANYPEPFVSGGSANLAIVYGTGSGVSNLDFVEASNIKEDLENELGTGSVLSSAVSGGDSVLLERSSDKLNLGDLASDVFVTSIDEDDLPTLLGEGTYTDDDNTEYDFTQKVTLGTNLGLEHFADSDYNNEEPTIGIKLSDDEHVLNYTLDFTTNPAYNASTMETTTLTLMGRDYYVLDVIGVGDSTTNQNKTTLLDSANTATVTEGETSTIDGKTVSIAFIGGTGTSATVKLEVDGETTNTLSAGGTYKLSDGTYIGIKEINVQDYAGGIKQVEFSIGTGKLELTHGADIELNDVTINDVKAFMIQDSSHKLDKWTVDDESFIAQDSDLLMPGFGALKISFGGFIAPSAEETVVQASSSDVMRLSTYIKNGAVNIDLLGANSTGEFDTIGKDTSNRLVTTTRTDLFFNETAGDKYIVASWNSSTEGESYYLKVDTVTEDSVNKLRFINEITGNIKKVSNSSDASFGSVVLTVNNLTIDGSKKWANISITSGASGTGSFHELYTDGGLKIYLPYFALALTDGNEGAINVTDNATAGGETASAWVAQGIYNQTIMANTGHGYASYYQHFVEEDYLGTLAAGQPFNVTFDESGSSNKVHVSAVGIATSGSYEIGETDDFEEYVISELATKTVWDTGGDQDWVTITYAGDQSYGELYLTAPEATVSSTVTGTTSLGEYLIKDTEVSSMSTRNLIVVGGSCINSAAAALVGGSYCSADWTTATGIGTGQFLIKGYASSTITSEMALLVAGYEAADTVNAATYLRTSTVDTSKEYKGTSSTSAELVVE